MIIYTDRFIPKKHGAITLGFIVLIRPKYKSDIGLIEHEKIHIEQWKRTFGLFWILYCFKKWRLKYEVEAYKVQLKYSPNDIDLFSYYLSHNYRLSITQEEAKRLLQ